MSKPRPPSLSALSLGCLVAGAAALVPSCLDRRDDVPAGEDTRCTSCHGDPSREGDTLRRSAPPVDLAGNADPSYPGVGAHSRHLDGSGRHAAVACSECHVVPEQTGDPGHADDEAPAEIVFGSLAAGGGDPAYDVAARTCADTYCHGGARAVWTAPRAPDDTCGSCHALPPPAPHPQSEDCAACHGAVIDEDRDFVAPELHVDGQVQVEAGDCASCHGSEESPAPPVDTSGNDARSAIGVGAHQVHLTGGNASRALSCNECHVVPEPEEPPEDSGTPGPSHADGLPAEVRFADVALTGNRKPTWDRDAATCADTWCHASPTTGAASPPWTSTTPLDCTGCHGAPPPPPHPAMDDCSLCHGQVVSDDDRTIGQRDLHVNGTVEFAVPSACNACHGGPDGAPPPDLAGNTSTTFASVGAHATHLEGTATARAVPCDACHVVPAETLVPGHLDSPRPAEVVFSGAATAFGATPTYDGTTCAGTACHGDAFGERHESGGTNTTPIWTAVGTGAADCGTCHGLPPGRPHPVADLNPVCSACHENINDDGTTFSRPELHVDGVVTFELP